MDRGVFTISIDTELAWGSFDRPYRERRLEQIAGVRDVIGRLLPLFEKYSISATWAVVGHLFLERCDRHPDMPRPRHAWFKPDWFAYDPGSDAASDPLWYGPDIVRRLQDATPPQEIASHSFSHPIFGDAGCSRACADADIAACVQAAEPYGVTLQSFVYPRNEVGHTDVLQRHGFLCYRGPDPTWYHGWPRPARRLAHYLDDLLALPPPTVMPKARGSLVDLPGSMMWQSMDGARALIPPACRTYRCLQGLRRAMRRREVFHLWFHPMNFCARPDAAFAAFEPVLRAAARWRDRGWLDILPMNAVAARFLPAELPA